MAPLKYANYNTLRQLRENNPHLLRLLTRAELNLQQSQARWRRQQLVLNLVMLSIGILCGLAIGAVFLYG